MKRVSQSLPQPDLELANQCIQAPRNPLDLWNFQCTETQVHSIKNEKAKNWDHGEISLSQNDTFWTRI
eukprot:11355206-Karenia_brevis.AAC.1